ncbi:MAG: formate dehydrogenase [Alphaproteobacteria bacterium]|nr:formate dehydrogenase [Alphaproteobacteria bacterium]
MDKSQKPAPRSRREFLRTAGQGAGAAVAGAAAVVSGAPAAATAEAAVPETGYRESAHVKRYYELAKF